MKFISIALVVVSTLTVSVQAETPEPVCQVRTCNDLSQCLGREIPAGYCRELTMEEARSEGLVQ